jgi:dTDP-glucose 4,6-dehydratase
MRLLVAGGAGFIGSEFVRMTITTHPDTDVTVVDKLTYAGNPRNLAPVEQSARYRFVRGDVCDAALMTALAREADVIVNFAAETHVDRSLFSAGEFINTDVFGTFVLLEAARAAGHERFVQVSTDEVYGEVLEGLSSEGDRLRPRSPYSASKAGAEMLISAYRASYGVGAIVTRGSNTYGQYQFPEKIVPLFITNAIDDMRLPIYGHGAAVRDYLHVSDHARGIDVALRRGTPGEDYNIGCRNSVSGVAVADAILAALRKPRELKSFVRDRPGHDYRYAMDTTKLQRLCWAPRVDFATGIEQTVRWYRDHEDWWRPLKSGDFWDFYARTYRVEAAAAR